MPPFAVREISGPAGRLEALLDEPELTPGTPLTAAVVFAHPHPLHGGTMHTKIVYRSAKALVSLGCAVLRFNFRGVGSSEGTFDNGIGEKDDFRAGLDFMVTRYPDADLWAAGFSFGSYISLLTGNDDDRVTTLVAIAPALHMYDFSPVLPSTKPKFFVQGANDEICPLPHLQAFFAELREPKKLAIVPGANQLFTGKVDEGAEALREMVAEYLTTASTSKP
jgi:alpha/beta superfamily hydrolase